MKYIVSLFVWSVMMVGSVEAARTLEVGPFGYPYSSIQAAIDAAVNGVDRVLVHDGVYAERINFKGKAITVRSVNGPDVTIIDGNRKGSVVVFNSGEEGDSLLEGFTIKNGHASNGGGIFCDNSSPTIINCVISGNLATKGGGGIFCRYSPWPLTIINCTISGNSAAEGGGILFNVHSASTIINCTVSDNSASREGGGVYYNNASSSSITDSIVSGNSTGQWGGGIYCWSSSVTISNCTISDNSAGIWGAGICLWSYSSPVITNCIISNNSAHGTGSWDGGGGIYCLAYSSPAITNCTISGNFASGTGGGVYCRDFSSPSIVNTILWDNDGAQIHAVSSSNPRLNYCDIGGGYPGLGNIDIDPKFIDPKANDYQLTAGSPCINFGHPRIYDVNDSRSDMGAYGGGGGSDPISVTVATDGSGDYTSIQDAVYSAVSGDSITVYPGTYSENLYVVGKDISLLGACRTCSLTT